MKLRSIFVGLVLSATLGHTQAADRGLIGLARLRSDVTSKRVSSYWYQSVAAPLPRSFTKAERQPMIDGDFRCFLATAHGFGTVGVKTGKPFLEVVSGLIDLRELRYTPAQPVPACSDITRKPGFG